MYTEQQQKILSECKRLEAEMRRKLGRKLTQKEEFQILYSMPEYQAMMAEKARKTAEMEEMFDRDERPLIEALTAAGWPLGVRQCGKTRSVWDFVNTKESFTHLLPVLAEHLQKPYHERIREGIARALIAREARGTQIPRIMMDELKKETDPDQGINSFRWVLIYALESVGDSSLLDEVRQLQDDPRYLSVLKELKILERKLS